MRPLIVTASTLRDSLANVQFFVTANLASGVDHMIVFLDAPGGEGQPKVAAWLREQEHVTCVPTGRRSWWVDGRPAGLNVRQTVNANVAADLLAPLPWARWLFHVDGDEVVVLDREALDAVPDAVDCLALDPWEAVSEWEQPERPTRFKRLLDESDLTLLHALGVLAAPANARYFHGHVMGKGGIRTGSGLRMTLHHGVDADGRVCPGHTDPRLRVLHYDAPSGEEFVRKWRAMAQAGPAHYRPSRTATATALRNLALREMPDDVRVALMRRIYETTTADDVALLDSLGLLVEHDPTASAGDPRALTAEERATLDARLAALQEQPKAGYFVREQGPPPAPPASVAARLRRRARRALGERPAATPPTTPEE